MSETVTASFVDCAVTVHTRALSVPAIRDIIFAAEEEWGVKTPFHSVYLIEAIIKRAKTEDNIAYACADICMVFRDGTLTHLSVRDVTGKGSGGKGVVDLALYKRDIMAHIALVETKKHKIPNDTYDVVKRLASSDNDFLSMLGGSNNPDFDITWMACLAPSGQMLVRLAGRPANHRFFV